MKNLVLGLLISLLSIGCGSQQVLSPEQSKGRILTVTHGGGFTGKYTTYSILENGQIFKLDQDSDHYYEQKSMKEDFAKQLFNNYDVLDIANVEIETYGNLLYSITMKSQDIQHKVSWERGDKGSEKLQVFYRNVMNQILISNNADTESEKSGIKAKF